MFNSDAKRTNERRQRSGSGKWINENKSNDIPPDIIEIDDISDNTTHFALYNRSRRMV